MKELQKPHEASEFKKKKWKQPITDDKLQKGSLIEVTGAMMHMTFMMDVSIRVENSMA